MHMICFDQTPHPFCPPLPLPSPCAQLSALSPLSAACMGTGAGSPPRQSICTLSRITSLENTLIPPVSMLCQQLLNYEWGVRNPSVLEFQPAWSCASLELRSQLWLGVCSNLVKPGDYLYCRCPLPLLLQLFRHILPQWLWTLSPGPGIQRTHLDLSTPESLILRMLTSCGSLY